MGSIQEPTSLSSAMASESRDVEMRDGDSEGEGPSNATGIPSQTNGVSDAPDAPGSPLHVTNTHVTSSEKNRARNSPSTPSKHFHNPSIPIPSVERDDDGSPSTAAEQEEKTSPSRGARNIPSPPIQAQQRPSTNLQPSDSMKINKEIARLNEVLSETSAQAAQKVLHDKWRFFLFDQYDESHISFILRAGFKNASPNVVERVLRDSTIFKEHFLDIASKKPEVIEKVLLNASASQIGNAPQRVLDKALAERLKTVSAKQLIKWLAEADRLGYKLDDIIDEDDESVIPNDTDMTDEVFEVEPPPPRFASAYRDPLLEQQEMNLAAQRIAALQAEAVRQQQKQLQLQQQYQQRQPAPPPPRSLPAPSNLNLKDLTCPHCGAGRFPTMSGYNYHVTKKPCQKQQAAAPNSKWRCENCIQGFTTKQGMDYHKLNQVCSNDDIAPPTSPSSQLQQEAQYRSSAPQNYAPPPGPVPRPSFTTQPPPSQSMPASYSSSPYSQPQPQARPPITVQRPPLHTPAPAPGPARTPNTPLSTPGPKKQSIPDDVRHSPSELSPEKLAALEKELQDAEDRYQQQIAEIPADYTAEQRSHRLTSLKNANASRKSQIRKAHGVSLRLREKDKVARKAAGITPPGRPRLENRPVHSASGTPTGTPAGTPPAPSFSPVNAPPRSGPSPSDYGRPGNPPHPSTASRYNGPSGNPPLSSSASQYNGPSSGHPPHPSNASKYNGPSGNPPHPSTVSSYKPPPSNAAKRVQSPYSEPHPNTLTHALEPSRPAQAGGFAVLRATDMNPRSQHLPQHLTPTNYPAQPSNPNKRRRSPEDNGRPDQPRTSSGPTVASYLAPNLFDQSQPTTRPPNQSYTPVLSPALSLMQVRAEDAAAKLMRKIPLAEGQKQPPPPPSPPITIVDRDTPMTEAPLPPPPTTQPPAPKTNTKETAITILSSSESESEPPIVKSPVPRKIHPAIRNLVEQEGEGDKGGDSTEEDEVIREDERREKEREEMRESRRGSRDGNVRRGFMARRGGKH